MHRLEIFEPAAGCSTGACGPDVAASQEAFEEALATLVERGIEVGRFNLGHEPEVFSENPMIKAALRAGGMASLPIVLVDGRILSQGGYPSRQELLVAASAAGGVRAA